MLNMSDMSPISQDLVDYPLPFFCAPRSPQWEKVRGVWIKANPICAACGGIVMCQVHHKKPFHLFPDLELDPSNFITLCESPNRLCHLRIGHCFVWADYNPFVVEDAVLSLSRIKGRLVA